jgi:glyoxylase-like metal-dependent hydrolase (beta-lactamase superfamily II)
VVCAIEEQRMKTQAFGDIVVDRVVECEGPFAALDFLLPDIDAEVLDEAGWWLRPRFIEPGTDQVVMSFHSLVVRTPRMTVLVDACVGNDKERPARPGWHRRRSDYLQRLAALGLAPDDIDVVMCTHLHADHVGWNTSLADGRWVPTFPRARYLFARREFDYWNDAVTKHAGTEPLNHGSFEDSVLPVVAAGLAELVDDGFEIDHGLVLEAAPGHTPGNVVMKIGQSNTDAVLTGDVLHTAVQLARPHVSSRFCTDPQESAETRTALIERYAETSTLILPAHFPAPVAGRIVREREAFRLADGPGAS